MKKIFYFPVIISMLLWACKKDLKNGTPGNSTDVPSSYMAGIIKYLGQHTAGVDFQLIDLNNYHISKQKLIWYVRFPFKNKTFAREFVLLQTDSLGNPSDGKIIELQKNNSDSLANDKTSFSGSIRIYSLDRVRVTCSKIKRGFIESFHPSLFTTNLVPPGNKTIGDSKAQIVPVTVKYDQLPEVVIVGYSPGGNSTGDISVADYIMLQSLFGGSGETGSGGYASGDRDAGIYGVYSPLDSGPNGTGISNTTGLAHIDKDITLSYDDSYTRPAIDINAWMKCFTNIPDQGAQSSVTLYGDLPESGSPNAGINIWNGNTGHCFLQLSKSNGSQSVSQVIGFTAQSAGRAIMNANAFVPGKIVDNAGHKYNCSITMSLTVAALNILIDKIIELSDMAYSIVNFDCLDFGLDIFNSVRPGNPLVIAKVYDSNNPFSNVANGPKLYTLLQSMLGNSSPETPNILLGNSLHAGTSHGACK